ncbi:MAG: hypothetical protein QW358_00305, partial [Candidatus Hadarchaeum sp.]
IIALGSLVSLIISYTAFAQFLEGTEYSIQIVPQPEQELVNSTSFPEISFSFTILKNKMPFKKEIRSENIMIFEDNQKYVINPMSVEQKDANMLLVIIFDSSSKNKSVDWKDKFIPKYDLIEEQIIKKYPGDMLQYCSTDYKKVCTKPFSNIDENRKNIIDLLATENGMGNWTIDLPLLNILNDISSYSLTPVVIIFKVGKYQSSQEKAYIERNLLYEYILKGIRIFILDFDHEDECNPELGERIRQTGGICFAAYASTNFVEESKSIIRTLDKIRPLIWTVRYKSHLLKDSLPHILEINVKIDEGDTSHDLKTKVSFQVPYKLDQEKNSDLKLWVSKFIPIVSAIIIGYLFYVAFILSNVKNANY